jgi:hypothetical protein
VKKLLDGDVDETRSARGRYVTHCWETQKCRHHLADVLIEDRILEKIVWMVCTGCVCGSEQKTAGRSHDNGN